MTKTQYVEKVSSFYAIQKESLYNEYLDNKVHKMKDLPYELLVIAICDSGKKPYAKELYEWVAANFELLQDRWKDHQEKYDLFEFMLEVYKEVI